MRNSFIKRALLCASLLSGLTMMPASAANAANDYPSRPITMIVPYSAGGNTDVIARLLAQRLGESMGQQVIVDNRPGGNTLIGTEAVARSAGDGYTILLTTLTFAVLPSLYKQLPFDTLKDFSPISLAVTLPNVLVINKEVPAQTLPELIDYAKKHPGKLNYSSTGSGTSPHLSMELLKHMSGIDAVHVPYKGGAQAMTDLLGNQIQAQFIGLPVALPVIEAGKLTAVGVTSEKRSEIAPEIPAIAEFLPGYAMNPWFGILGPKGMPAAVVQRLQEEIARVLREPEVKKRLQQLGAEPVGSTPESFAEHIKNEITLYQGIIDAAGIKLE
ncbi:MAG: tripartite tricarboxylate transporter substrate binding protein [Candidimonas sp.]|jgi:tripartite-type tricarboxylate transporter receptor subunit TctC